MRKCINNCKNHPTTTSFVKRHCKNVSEENMFVLIWKRCTNNCKNHPNTRWHWTKMTWVKIRSCSVWDTDSSNGVTFKHVMWPSVWTLSVRGSALGPVPFPVRNTGKQLWKHEAKLKHGPETEKSRPDCLVAHSNETWCHRQLKLNLRVGGQSWSLPRITGGRWDCEREEYSLQGKSYLARVAVGLEPGTCRGVCVTCKSQPEQKLPAAPPNRAS